VVDVGTTIAGVLIAVVGGGVGLRMARRRWAIRQEIATARGVDAGAVEPGVVELAGTAVSAGETFTSPLTGQDCVAYQFEVEELRRKHERSHAESGGTNRAWETVTDLERAAPFYVEEEAAVPVDAPVADFELERAYEIDSDEATASTAGKLLATITGGDASPDVPVTDERREEMRETTRERRYRERLIRPGESVYVYGEAMPTADVPRSGTETGTGSAISSLLGMLASSERADGSLLGAVLSAVGGDTRGYRRAKRRGHERGGFEDVGTTAPDGAEGERPADPEALDDLQGIDPEEMNAAERRRVADAAESFVEDANDGTTPVGSALDEVANAVEDRGGDGPLAREDLVVSRGETVGEFVVSDREKADVVRSYTLDALKWGAGALATVAAGTLVVATGVGVI